MNQNFFNLCLAGFTLIGSVAFAQNVTPPNANSQQVMPNTLSEIPNGSKGLSTLNAEKSLPLNESDQFELSDNTMTDTNQPTAFIDSGGSLQAAPSNGAQPSPGMESSQPASASLGTELAQPPSTNQNGPQQPSTPAPASSATDSSKLPQSQPMQGN